MNKTTQVREVKIKEVNSTYFVEYVEHQKHGKYNVAIFDGRLSNLEKVISWVNNQSNLKLV